MTSDPQYSIVIPVYNSATTLQRVVAEVTDFLESKKYTFEILLINDASSDDSWAVAETLSKQMSSVTAIDLTKNCGQHTALFCGLNFAKGAAIVTMDDDLQNPAEEIQKLIQKAAEGHDLVLGKYEVKQHPLVRRVGSRVVQWLHERVFDKPRNLVLTNFRLISRSIVERVQDFKGPKPYLPGLLLVASARPANVLVRHRPSAQTRSRYSFSKLLGLVGRLLFHYSVFPLRVLVVAGGAVSIVAFTLGCFFLVKGLIHPSRAVGWTSLVVLFSFFSGFIILLLGVLGEYVIHIVKSLNHPQAYYVRKVIRHGD